jgi:hypothetical protein
LACVLLCRILKSTLPDIFVSMSTVLNLHLDPARMPLPLQKYVLKPYTHQVIPCMAQMPVKGVVGSTATGAAAAAPAAAAARRQL